MVLEIEEGNMLAFLLGPNYPELLTSVALLKFEK
jgi:hypothetical protein